MEKMPTVQLLKELGQYDFFDWESEADKTLSTTIGMSKAYREQYAISDALYDSWGYDALNNKFANPSFSKKEWRHFEKYYFKWLQPAIEQMLMEDDIIVTPNFTNDWQLEQDALTSKWLRKQHQTYEALLEQAGVILMTPILENEYRGAKLQSYEEFKIVARLAIKGVPLLFFYQHNIVWRVTEYLTLQLFYRQQEKLTCFSIVEQEILMENEPND